jgi:6-phospho-3-hexuloisomerase
LRIEIGMTISDIAKSALSDAARVVERLDARSFEAFAQAIAGARTIALHGLGREGLQMKGLAMRLFHLGLDAHVVGEMTTQPVGAGDLLICSAGPGDFASIAALARIAKDAGAKTAIVTAQPASNLAKNADHVLHIPAQDHGRRSGRQGVCAADGLAVRAQPDAGV